MSFVKYFGFEKSYRTSIVSDKPHECACCNPITVLYPCKLFFSIVDVEGSCFKTLSERPCLILSHNLLSCCHWKSGDNLPKCLKSRDVDDKTCIDLYSACIFISHKATYSKNISNSCLFTKQLFIDCKTSMAKTYFSIFFSIQDFKKRIISQLYLSVIFVWMNRPN